MIYSHYIKIAFYDEEKSFNSQRSKSSFSAINLYKVVKVFIEKENLYSPGPLQFPPFPNGAAFLNDDQNAHNA